VLSATSKPGAGERTELPKRYYRPSEITRRTGLAKTAVFRAIYSGDLEAHQPAGTTAWLIPADALDRWILREGGNAA